MSVGTSIVVRRAGRYFGYVGKVTAVSGGLVTVSLMRSPLPMAFGRKEVRAL